jgi:hypothetical protein
VGLERVTTVLEDVSRAISGFVVATCAGWPTFAGRAADGARQDDIFLPCAAVEQVAAVVAEHERADGGHFGL